MVGRKSPGDPILRAPAVLIIKLCATFRAWLRPLQLPYFRIAEGAKAGVVCNHIPRIALFARPWIHFYPI